MQFLRLEPFLTTNVRYGAENSIYQLLYVLCWVNYLWFCTLGSDLTFESLLLNHKRPDSAPFGAYSQTPVDFRIGPSFCILTSQKSCCLLKGVRVAEGSLLSVCSVLWLGSALNMWMFISVTTVSSLLHEPSLSL